jgi:acyl-CoA synthetase (AMP-forming)/AMP-acid ligase II
MSAPIPTQSLTAARSSAHSSTRVGRAPPALLAVAGNLAAFVRVYADGDPERPALHFADGRTLHYGELDEWGGRLGEVLHGCGVGPGTRVLLLVPMSPILYPLLFGVMAIGGVSVIVDPSMGLTNLRQALRKARPDVVVAVARGHLLRILPELWRARPCVVGPVSPLVRPWCGTRVDVAAEALPRGTRPLVRVAEDDDAFITFTTGSTGAPKGARRSHGLLNRQGAVIDGAWPRHRDDVDLATLPVFATTNLAAGIATVFPPIDLRRVDLDDATATDVRNQMITDGVTTCGGSPAFIDAIARAILQDGIGVPTVRAVALGGAPVLPDMADRVARALPKSIRRVVYGATECEPIATIDADAVVATRAIHEAGGGCLVGHVHPSVTVHLEPVTGVVGAGEVCVAGPQVLEHYVDDAATTAATIHRDGQRFMRTGDVARRDDDGRLWLLGRVSEAVVGLDGVVRFPLPVEAIARARGVTAAFVAVDGRSVLCVTDGDIAAVVDLADVVMTVPLLPTDPRHRARIDRRALRTSLRGRLPRRAP